MPEAATSDLVAIDVAGADRASHLDAVTTQRFVGADPGTVLGWLVLDAKGAPLAQGWALVDDERFLLLAPPAAADHVLDVLATRTFLADVTFTRLDLPVATVGGGNVDEVLAAAGLALAPDTWRRAGDGATQGADEGADEWAGGLLVVRHAFGVEVVGTADAGDLLDVDATDDLDGLRIRRGEPRWGHEVVPGRLPEEYGLLATHVHLAKGCYPGQEPIAHMWMLGRPRRRLVRLDRATAGGEVPAGPAGEADVTGVAGTTAMGFVRPEVGPGAGVVDDLVVTAVVGADRDVVGWTPAQTRRRDREDGDTRPGRRP